MFPPPLVYILLQQLAILTLFLRVLTSPRRTIGCYVPGMTADFGIAVNAEVFSLTHPEVYHAFLLSTPVC
jgi:hypothetical protein